MIYEDELTYEKIKDFVEYTELIYKDVDVSLLEGIIAVLNHASQVLENDNLFSINTSKSVFMDKLYNKVTQEIMQDNEEFSQERTLDGIEEFYRTLSPRLGDFAHNLISRINISANISIFKSNCNSFFLRGDLFSILLGAHEFAHRFAFEKSKEEISKKKIDYKTISKANNDILLNSMIYELFLIEVDALYAELLCKDYIEFKYNKSCEKSLLIMLASIQSINKRIYIEKNISTIEALKYFSEYLRFIRTNHLNMQTLDSYIQMIKKLDNDFTLYNDIFYEKRYFDPVEDGKGRLRNRFLRDLTYYVDPHDIGFLFSNYLHQNVDFSKAKEASELFEKLLKVNAYKTENFEQERIEAIIKAGLPFIVKDGRISMDKDGIEKINIAFDKMYSKFKSRHLKQEKINILTKTNNDEVNKRDEQER